MKIHDLVEEGYSIFSSYKISSTLDVCKVCCISDDEERKLTRTPLRELDEDILQAYINSAASYSEREKYEMHYFLPRILDLISQNIFPTICTDTIFDRLFREDPYEYTGSEKEYQFLSEFLLEYWKHFLNNSKNSELLNGIIICIGRHFDIKPMLKFWEIDKSEQATLYFAELIIHLDRYGILGYYSTEKLNHEIENWLADKRTYKCFTERMETLYYNGNLNDYDSLMIESAYTLYLKTAE